MRLLCFCECLGALLLPYRSESNCTVVFFSQEHTLSNDCLSLWTDFGWYCSGGKHVDRYSAKTLPRKPDLETWHQRVQQEVSRYSSWVIAFPPMRYDPEFPSAHPTTNSCHHLKWRSSPTWFPPNNARTKFNFDRFDCCTVVATGEILPWSYNGLTHVWQVTQKPFSPPHPSTYNCCIYHLLSWQYLR